MGDKGKTRAVGSNTEECNVKHCTYEQRLREGIKSVMFGRGFLEGRGGEDLLQY